MKNNNAESQEQIFACGFSATPETIVDYLNLFPDEFPDDQDISLENLISYFIMLMIEYGNCRCDIDNALRTTFETMEVYYKNKRNNKCKK